MNILIIAAFLLFSISTIVLEFSNKKYLLITGAWTGIFTIPFLWGVLVIFDALILSPLFMAVLFRTAYTGRIIFSKNDKPENVLIIASSFWVAKTFAANNDIKRYTHITSVEQVLGLSRDVEIYVVDRFGEKVDPLIYALMQCGYANFEYRSIWEDYE